jgi:type I restriction enzyme, S subunit
MLRDAAGNRGIFTDGDWILTENMDVDGTVAVIQLKHVGVNDFLRKPFTFISERTFFELNCTEVFPGDILISRMADPLQGLVLCQSYHSSV